MATSGSDLPSVGVASLDAAEAGHFAQPPQPATFPRPNARRQQATAR